MPKQKILLAHGNGGRLMHGLIRDLLLKKLNNPILRELSDSAVIGLKDNKLAFTTDSFVVNPLFFLGADIGKLAVYGTANDLVMLGARPEYLSLGLIIEEGLDYKTLEKIVDSISAASKRARVYFVTGDIKVVEKGSCDKIFINTSGIGGIIKNKTLSIQNIEAGDKIIVTGNIAQHGLAVLSKRGEFGFSIKSDCAYLGDLIIPILRKTDSIRFMRDPTRGGLATTLSEVAEALNLGVVIEEKNIPISPKVRAACELLGMDPLYVANEGCAIMAVKPGKAGKILNLLRKHSLGKNAREIGTIVKEPRGRVVLNTVIGTRRIVDMLTAQPLPRIC